MNIDELKKQIPDESSCRKFFEKLIWPNGRLCPHCNYTRSYRLKGITSRAGLYECANCKRQFTVTTKTPMHSTKLPLWKWLLAIYYILNSSKGISSVFLSRLIGVKQSTGWKMGHAIRLMMDNWAKDLPLLTGTIEIDEKYFGGKPRHRPGIIHKRGASTCKQLLLIAIQRHGPVYPTKMDILMSDKIVNAIDPIADRSADLMTDKSHMFHKTGRKFASHQCVKHRDREYARGDIHVNTAESFNAMLERAKSGVFHFMSQKHLGLYLSELSFRWANRDQKKYKAKNGKQKTRWKPKG